MFTTFFDKLSGFFDRRFIVSYWAPTMLGLLLTLALIVANLGVETAAAWWDARAGTQQLMFGLSVLFLAAILAYLLQAFATQLMRVYEGWGGRRTRLGRLMDDAESYSYQTYMLPGERFGPWWPRLMALLPDDRRARLDDAFAAVVALLNLATVFGLWAFLGGGYTALVIRRSGLFLAIYVGGLLLAWLCYQGALARTQNFADLIETAFDYHRHDILEQLHIPLPDSLAEERILWYKLNQLAYNGLFPWDVKLSEVDSQLPDDPFHYDSYTPPSPPAKPTEIHIKGDVNLRGASTVTVRSRGGG